MCILVLLLAFLEKMQLKIHANTLNMDFESALSFYRESESLTRSVRQKIRATSGKEELSDG